MAACAAASSSGVKSNRPRSSAAADTADEASMPATPAITPLAAIQFAFIVHVEAKEIGAPRRRRKLLLGAAKQFQGPCEKQLVCARGDVAVDERAGFEIAHGRLVQIGLPSGIENPGKGLVAKHDDACERGLRHSERVQSGAGPARSTAGTHGDDGQRQRQTPKSDRCLENGKITPARSGLTGNTHHAPP